MTVRDGARYLAQALESVLAQTFPDWQLILWDDGSTDDTLVIARSFAEREPRIRLYTGAAIGRRRALVEAHRAARGTYLGWLDADDWLAPEALAKTHAAITSSGADMVYTDHVVVGSDGAVRGPNRRANIPYSSHRLLLDFMTFHFRLFSRDVFDRAGGIDPDREIAIDYDLCLRISEHGRIERINEVLHHYRVHEAQMSTRQRRAQIAASADAIRAALVRRGMTSYELVVDLERGKFRLERRRIGKLQLAMATAFPRLRRAETIAKPSAIGLWPSAGQGIAYPGGELRPLGRTLASLMRAVWTGRAGDMLRIHDIAPLLEANDDGSVLGACWLFLKTLDHALARHMRIEWIANGPLTTHARHAKREAWCRRELASRCHRVVTSSAAPFRELGVPADRIVVMPSAGPRPVAKLVEKRPVPGTLPISIVIPIRNRAGADVRNALASLAWQRGGRPWEVILVSHGSEPAIDAELRALAIEAGASLITVGTPSDPWNKPLALNTGIRATDPAIAFVMTMDGDMILAENMLGAILDELREDPKKVVLCQSSDLPEGCELPEDLYAQFEQLRQRATVRGRFGTGGIQATSRSFLIEARGYDEDMLWWGALDTDLVRRAEAAGLRTSWITDRTAMLHQWHPRKQRVLASPGVAAEAQDSWQRNHELMIERAGHITRNEAGWGAAID